MQVTCPACKKTLQSKADLSGKTVKCPCGHAFVAPKNAAAPAASTSSTGTPAASSTASQVASKITVQCSCGKTLQAPAAAAGKAVKCPCGQVVKVPAAAPATAAKRVPTAAPVAAMAAVAAPAQNRRPAPQPVAVNTAPNPFGDISDDEWSSMVQTHAPKQVDTSKPKEKTAAAKMLEQARQETGQGDSLAMESALGFLNKTRGILVGLGILFLVRVSVDYWFTMSFIETLAAGGEEPEVIAFIKWVVFVFCAIGAGVATFFIIAGFLVSFLPMTCTISALVLFALLELMQLIVDPLSLLSIRGWIFRIFIFGGLIQGINNAAYYKHLKAEEKAAKKQRRG